MSVQSTILILDDEPLMRLMLKDGMERAGFFTEAVGTCEEALRVIRSGRIDAGLFDMRLPDGSGLDVIRSARDDGRRFPMLVLSAEANCVEPSVAKELDLTAVCMKPPSIPDLVQMLQAALGQSGEEVSKPQRVGTYQVWSARTGTADFFEALAPEDRVVIDCVGQGADPLDERVEEFIASAGDRVAVSGADEASEVRWKSKNSLLVCVKNIDEIAAAERRFNSSAERAALLDSVVQHNAGGAR